MPLSGLTRDPFGDVGGDGWIAVEYGDGALTRLVDASVIERLARTEPMVLGDTKQVPRYDGFEVSNTQKGTAYVTSVGEKDHITLLAQKVGGLKKIADEDLVDTAADPLQVYRDNAADALAVQLDNSCLGVTADANPLTTGTVKFRSVYNAVRGGSDNAQVDDFDAALGYTADDNYDTSTESAFIANASNATYVKLSNMLAVLEGGHFWSEVEALWIAHPRFAHLLRTVKDANGDPLMRMVGLNPLNQRPMYDIFGVPLTFSRGAKTSAVDTQSPAGNPLLIAGNRRMLIRGTRALSDFIPANTFGVALQRSAVGAGFSTDESLFKSAYRRGFQCGTATAFSVLEIVP